MFHVSDFEAGVMLRANRAIAEADQAVGVQAAAIAKLRRQIAELQRQLAAERQVVAVERSRRIAAEAKLQEVYSLEGIGPVIRAALE